LSQEKFDLVISADKSVGDAARELFEYRELFYILAWRDFKVRYKQTVIGALWALLRPLLTMVVFTIVFGKIAGLPSQGDAPYAIMVFAAMLPWYFFSSSFQEGSNALVANANVISKVYFPRIIVPVSSLFVNFVDFLISFGVLALVMVFYQFSPSGNIIYLPLFVLLMALFTVGLSLWMSALNVQYRDVRYVVPFIVQLGLYVSPVGFASSVVANEWRVLYSLNPMVGVIDGFRWCVIGGDANFYWPSLWLSIAVTVVLLVTGSLFFLKAERKFADVI
jgi:lipopolysaccharide transport system permease protein